MRSALKKLDGISFVEIQQGNKDFTVGYDSSKVDVDRMLAVLAGAGEPAKPR